MAELGAGTLSEEGRLQRGRSQVGGGLPAEPRQRLEPVGLSGSSADGLIEESLALGGEEVEEGCGSQRKGPLPQPLPR